MARRDALLRLQQILLKRRAELRRRLGMEMLDLGDVGRSQSGDSADVAFDAASDELASQLAEVEARELRQIERALVRLKQGTYGTCEACGGKIPVARLSALPYSTLCIKCQREMENDASWAGGRHGGDWDRVSDGDAMEDREVDISDLEIDMSR
ncbi:MAG TPA: TraR/DksA C4-type zinc finger protein [Gemmataceae bacterium]